MNHNNIFPYPLLRIGIIGGGQLGKMTAQKAKQMGFHVAVLDPSPQCPTSHIADVHIVGNLYDAAKLRELAHISDVLTYEIEHVDTDTLKSLYNEGHAIYPSPYVLETIQDKLKQKQVLERHGVPVPRYEQVDTVTVDYLANHPLPLVQKIRTGGYDGKGVVVLKNVADHDKILPTPSLVEEFIEIAKELAIIVVRAKSGETVCYPVVEMIFDDKTNICDIVTAPARIDSTTAEHARRIAVHAVEALEGVGVFGVEMFLTHSGNILVNEIAPRPHNSGHYTIEACITCQFEQLIRVISGLPLGNSHLLMPVAMLNLLGEAGYSGKPIIEGLSEALAIPGLSFHLYGKEITQPYRKMGHITIIDAQLENAIANLQKIKNVLKIKAIAE